MQQPVFLVGFMGAGKSHIGLQLADYLYCPFLDLDQYLEKRAGRRITEIFARDGEAWFRLLERRALHDTSFRIPGVIATGGGTPCFFNNMDWMNRHGIVIYLDTAPEVLFQRLWRGRHKRPLLKDLSKQRLQNFITHKIAARRSFYERANERANVHYRIQRADQNSAAEISALMSTVTGH